MNDADPVFIFRPSFTDVVPLSLITKRSESGLYEALLIEYWCNWDLRNESEMPLRDAGPIVVSRRIETTFRALSPSLQFTPVVLHQHPRWRGKRQTSPPWRRESVPAAKPGSGESDARWSTFTDVPELDCIDWSNASEDNLLGVSGTQAYAANVGVLRPETGFPPLFAIAHACDATYFVSGEAHARLLALGVRGIDFGKPIPVRASLRGRSRR